jgi:hypothetical protein
MCSYRLRTEHYIHHLAIGQCSARLPIAKTNQQRQSSEQQFAMAALHCKSSMTRILRGDMVCLRCYKPFHATQSKMNPMSLSRSLI